MDEQRNRQNVVPFRGMPPDPQEAPKDGSVAAEVSGHYQKPGVGKNEISEALRTLQRYKAGKANLENRIVDDELWWELRHWESLRQGRGMKGQPLGAAQGGAAERAAPEPSSAWLFNAILNKHADAMDNFPEPVVLPRERGDEGSARTLSAVLPVVLDYNHYEQTYSDNWWEKLKHGTAAYGVFWNPEKENGLGDIDIQTIDLLKLFWEPGITDIQSSRNLFLVELVDTDLLEREYPEHRGRLGADAVTVRQYLYDDTVDVSGKSVVVDWYYKRARSGGGTVLHYAKFVGDVLLYASENDRRYAGRGFYDHGKYPVVLDVLFPEKGTPAGFGYVAICKDPQLYIDKLSANILENAMMTTKKRFFVSESTAINQDEFLDWNRPLVHVAGELGDERVREIVTQPLSSVYLEVMNLKIDEMKDTAANRDVNSGGTGRGVTAAAAIAALQEAGNKASRDMISTSYRAHIRVAELCVELMRQFYDETRAFRITGVGAADYTFVDFSNAGIRDQLIGVGLNGEELFRRPVFDLKIRAQKKNPFSRMEQNERAKELYSLGFFQAERAQEALVALEMMDFDGIDKVRDSVRQGQTLLNQVRQLTEQLERVRGILVAMGAQPEPEPGRQAAGAPAAAAQVPAGGGRVTDGIMQSRLPQTSYMQDLTARSRPSLE